MKYMTDVTTWIIGIGGSMYAFVTGHTSEAFQILLLFMIIDVGSGVLKGIQKKRLKSAIMSLGIIKKAGLLLSIVFAILLDNLLNQGTPVFGTMMTWLAIGNEGLSIVENLAAIGVKIPASITDKLAQFTEESTQLQNEKDEVI